MPRHAVKLLATLGACSALAITLSSGGNALEIETPHVTVPTPHITVPKPDINVPTVNTGRNWLSNHAKTHAKFGTGQGSTVPGGKSLTTTVNTPFVGPSNGTGSPEGKVITETLPNGPASADGKVITTTGGGASSGVGSPGGPNTSPVNTLPASILNNRDGLANLGPINTGPVTDPFPPPYGTAAYFNWLTGGGPENCGAAGGGEDAAFAADVQTFEQEMSEASRDPGHGSATDKKAADWASYMNYLIYLLGLTQDAHWTGVSFTPQETAEIEQAITACINSPSTCDAATITALNNELEAQGVAMVFGDTPSGYIVPPGTPVFYSPAQIVSPTSGDGFYGAAEFLPGGLLPLSNQVCAAVASP
jgi:hypothetical protein